jgi:hypothetical protein
MTVVDRVMSPAERSSITKLSLAGAICYALWGCLHLQAAHAVYHVGTALARPAFPNHSRETYVGENASEIAARSQVRARFLIGETHCRRRLAQRHS